MRTKSTRRLVRVLELSERVLVAVAQPTGECLSRNAYHSPPRGTGLRTNAGGLGRLSKNTYLSPSCGTRLRTKRFRGEAVCPKIRTTCSPKACGTGSRTNEGGARACSVRKSVPHRAAAHVVRVRGQTGPAGELFVQKHVPLPLMWYASADKRLWGRSFVQKPVPLPLMWYGSTDKLTMRGID